MATAPQGQQLDFPYCNTPGYGERVDSQERVVRMRTGKALWLSAAAFAIMRLPAAAQPVVRFSSYLGGNAFEHIRDVAIDTQGNIYLAGGTASPDFPTTPGAYDRSFNGWVDVFVTKLDPSGQTIIWSTYLGGPDYDRAYGIEVDAGGAVYVTGRAGPGFPTSTGSFQPVFNGFDTGSLYGDENCFVAKLSADGARREWASYAGAWDGCRDLAVDQNGDVYLPLRCDPLTGSQTPCPAAWLSNAFQSTSGGNGDDMVAKIAGDGSRVLWATYLGGSGEAGLTPSLRVDDEGNAYLLTQTDDPTMPTTPGAYDTVANGGYDMYVAKVSPDGSDLIWGTYLGGSGTEFSETHGLALAPDGSVIVAATTRSTDFPTTSGVAQTTFGGTGGSGNLTGDGFITRIAADGTHLIASTFLGGASGDGIEGVGVDALGNVYVGGGTYSSNFPITATAFQQVHGGNADFFATVLAPDLRTLLYSTFLGSGGYDAARTATADASGSFVVAGETASSTWPRVDAVQGNYGGGSQDGAMAHFGGGPPPPTPSPLACAASPVSGCQQPGARGSLVRLHDDPGGGRDKLVWKWRASSGTAVADFGNPLTSTRYALCVYDEVGGTPQLSASASLAPGSTCAGGSPCWLALGARGYRFQGGAAPPNGIVKVRLRAHNDGSARVQVLGKGAALSLPVPANGRLLQEDPAVVVQLVTDQVPATCWEAVFSTAAAKSSGDTFKDVSD